MNRDEWVKKLKQPQLIGDLVAGSVAAIGLFGCFYPQPIVKQLSFTTLLTGVASLGANAALAKLYTDTAASVVDAVLERELRESHQALSLSESYVLELGKKIAAWETFWSQQEAGWEQQEAAHSQMKASLLDEMREAVDKLKEAHQERDRLEKEALAHSAQIDRLNERIAALQEQIQSKEQELSRLKAAQQAEPAQREAQQQQAIDTLAVKLQHSLSQSIAEWKDSLLDTLQAEIRKQPAFAPRLDKIAAEAKAIATSYYQQITELPHSDLRAVVNGAISLQHHSAIEFAALKVKYRNALNIAAITGLQAQIEEQKIEIGDLQSGLEETQRDSILRSQHEAILSEYRLKQQQTFSQLAEKADAMESDLNGDTDEFVQKLLKQIEDLSRDNTSLQSQVHDLHQPRNFNPATREDLRMGNQIIEYFWLHRITLDRAGSDYRKHEATLHFHTDRNARLILPADLNEHAHKLQQVCRCLNLPEFKYDSESGLMSIYLQLSRKPAPDPADVLKSIGTPEAFIKYLSSHPISYRLIGDKGKGKSPLMSIMVSHFLKIGGRKGNVPNGAKLSKMLVGVSYPNAEHSQKDENYPLAPFLFARNDEECAEAIAAIYKNYQLRRDPALREFVSNFFQLWVIDEADNTLDFSASNAATKMRSIFNDAGHSNIGWIFAGQSVNTTKLKGWTDDDRKKSTEIVIEADKILAWIKAYGDGYYGEDRLAAIKKNVEEVREVIAKQNESIADTAKHYRLALVADSVSPKLFFIPDFNSIDFDLEAYGSIRREADAALAASGTANAASDAANPDSAVAAKLPASDYVGVGCPKCSSGILNRVKTSRGVKHYLCDTCGKSTSEKQLQVNEFADC